MDINQTLEFILNLDYYRILCFWSLGCSSKTDSKTPESIAKEAETSATSFSMSQLSEYKSIYYYSPDGWHKKVKKILK